MSGQHRSTRRSLISLRATGCILAGVALAGTIAATNADASVQHVTRNPTTQGSVAHAGAVPQKAPHRIPRKARAAKPITAQTIIKLAEKQVGISGRPNKFADWYAGTARAKQTLQRDGGVLSDYRTGEWCDMFVSWLGHKAGVAKTLGSDAYTVEHAKWFQRHHRWGTTPKPGAIVFYAWNGGGTDGIGHVGLVVRPNSDGTIETVEGNTSDSVQIMQRDTSAVVGYGYPRYAK